MPDIKSGIYQSGLPIFFVSLDILRHTNNPQVETAYRNRITCKNQEESRFDGVHDHQERHDDTPHCHHQNTSNDHRPRTEMQHYSL